MNPELEQAFLVERQTRVAATFRSLRVGEALHRERIGNQYAEARAFDPVEQSRISAVERAMAVEQNIRVRLAAHIYNGLAVPGMQADHVAFLDHDAVRVHDASKVIVGNEPSSRTEVVAEVDQHPASLDAGFGHLLDAEPLRCDAAWRVWTNHVQPAPEAIIIADLV